MYIQLVTTRGFAYTCICVYVNPLGTSDRLIWLLSACVLFGFQEKKVVLARSRSTQIRDKAQNDKNRTRSGPEIH